MDKLTVKDLFSRLDFNFRRRVPRIIQTEAAECGLACLAMVCGFHGFHVDLFNLRKQYGISLQGATLAHLVDIATALKLKTRALSLDIEEIDQLKTPCVLHWDLNHFVVLVTVRASSVVIHDPATGRKVISKNEFSKHFTGVALELWPASDFSQKTQKSRLKLADLIKNIRGLKGFLIKIFCLSLLIESINLLIPVGTQLVIDHVINAEDYNLLALICMGLVFFTLFRTFTSVFRSWFSIVLDSLVDVQWKAGLFDHLMTLPLSFFKKRSLGDIQSRFDSLATLRVTLTTSIVSAIIDGIMAVGLLIMMILYGGWLVWVALGFTSIYILLRLLTYYYFRQASEEQIIKDAKAKTHFMETFYGVSTIKALGLTAIRAQNWLNLSIEAVNATIHITKLNMLFGGVNSLIGMLEQIIILWIGASLVMDGNMTLGMYFAFNTFRGQFAERASNLINLAFSLTMLTLHCERISDIALSEGEVLKPTRTFIKRGEPAELKIRNLSFQYDPFSKPLFSELTLTIAAGESVALVGPSGIGKTTLMNIISGLLIPTKGEVLINGVEINALGLNNYRDCIACVLQEDKLFSGSIAENIASFDKNIDMEWVIACARYANINDDIDSMPMGYESIISELGGSLSGGQKQRLLIARALYRRPSILFLDEATSHLDLINEAAINLSIASLNITRIMIAHRPSTIASAQRVIQLDQLSSAAL
ncbi:MULTISPECIES: peptidase domain-containing ABC transporter [Yersinia]|uniref:peptidase domain-containing ABC transporter n=1 Tax=Yersinia TaxID=629 RepID=UPI000EB41DE5|nr:peptidase domain-containing ABC transporter [Yersinia sp. IP36721]